MLPPTYLPIRFTLTATVKRTYIFSRKNSYPIRRERRLERLCRLHFQ